MRAIVVATLRARYVYVYIRVYTCARNSAYLSLATARSGGHSRIILMI